MICKSQIVFYFIIFCIITPALSQVEVCFAKSDYEYNNVNYQESDDPSQRVCNVLITELAKSIPRRFEFTAYKYFYKQVLRVIAVSPGNYEASVDINEADCSGDIKYKDFEISDVLFPNRIDIKITLLNKYRNVVKSVSVEKFEIKKGYNKVVFFEFSDTISKPSFDFIIENKRIYYDSTALSAFRNKLKLIDDYYDSKNEILKNTTKLEKFDFSNVDMILVYDIMLKEVEKQVETLYNYDFPGNLQLSHNDPVNFIDRFTEFSEFTMKVRIQENYCLAYLDKMYHDKGIYYLKENDVNKAVLYFKRAISYNYYYAPSHYQYACYLLNHDSLYKAADVIGAVFSDMNPDPVTKDSILNFTQRLFDEFTERGNEFLNLEKYNEALLNYENAVKFCTNCPGIECSENFYKGKASAKFGLYKSYLSVAEKAIKNSKFELALIYIEEARKYQAANSTEIIGNAAADAVTEKLAKAYVRYGDSLNARGMFEKAVEYYDNANKLCSENPDVNCINDLQRGYCKSYNGIYANKIMKSYSLVKSGRIEAAGQAVDEVCSFRDKHTDCIYDTRGTDTIKNRIAQIRYSMYYAESEIFIGQHEFEKALVSLENAQQLFDDFVIKKDLQHDSLIYAIAKIVVGNAVANATVYIEKDNLDSAMAKSRNIYEIIEKYSITDDYILSAADEMFSGLKKLKCKKNGEHISYLLSEGRYASDSKDFINGMKYFREALSISDSLTECNFNNDEIYAAISFNSPAEEYLLLIEKAFARFSNHDSNGFFEYYKEAQNYYYDNNVSRYSLVHKNLDIFLTEKANNDYIIAGAKFFIKIDSLDICLKLLEYLRQNGVLFTETLEIQELLGNAMAKRDDKIIPGVNVRRQLKIYTATDKWYKPLRTAYLKTLNVKKISLKYLLNL